MTKNIVFRIIAALVLLAAVAGIAGFAFNAGVARGAALNLQAPAGGVQVVPGYAYGMPYMHPFFGFGVLGLLVPLFLIFLVFGAVRRLIWGPRWGWHQMHHMRGAPWGTENTPGNDFVPPMFAEWHKRAHGQTPSEENKA